jgi:predicted phosphodiesterase
MTISFIHLSDIHFGQEKGGEIIIHEDVKNRLIDDVATMVGMLPGKKMTGIIITGDIAFSGKREEYRKAATWLDRVANAACCEITDIQVVPGNHDIDRTEISGATELMLRDISDHGETKLDLFLENENDRELLHKRFHAYRPFAEGYDCPLDVHGGCPSRLVELAPGRKLRFMGLNSALICSKKDEEGRLLLGARQRVLPITEGEELVVLSHHPLHWFQDSEDARLYIRNRARIFISGHEHNPSVKIEHVQNNCALMMLAAGATVPPANEEYNYTYNVLQFDWDQTADALKVTVHPRAWSEEKKLFDADTSGLIDGKSVYTLNCPKHRPTPSVCAVPEPENSNQQIRPIDIIIGERSITEEREKTVTDQYPLLLLRFFRDLSSGQRLAILVKLGALPDDWAEPMTHALERRLLDSLNQAGRLEELTRNIDELMK